MRWDDIEEIAMELEDSYSEEKIPLDNIKDLVEMVLSLQNFEDYETEIDESILHQILEHWIEIRNEK